MLERDLIKRIRDFLRKEFAATVHKAWGGAYTEIGHADLYGTLPTGRAFYFEVKLPENPPTPPQLNFLARERANGALTGVVHSVEEVEDLLSTSFIDSSSGS